MKIRGTYTVFVSEEDPGLRHPYLSSRPEYLLRSDENLR